MGCRVTSPSRPRRSTYLGWDLNCALVDAFTCFRHRTSVLIQHLVVHVGGATRYRRSLFLAQVFCTTSRGMMLRMPLHIGVSKTGLARKPFDHSKQAPLPHNPQCVVMHHRHQLFVDVRSHDREYFLQQTSMRITPYHQALTCSQGRTYRLHR